MRTLALILCIACSLAGAEPVFQDRFEVDMSSDMVIAGYADHPFATAFSPDLSKKANLPGLGGAVGSLSFNHDYSRLAVDDGGELVVYDTANWSKVDTGITTTDPEWVALELTFSHDGSMLVVAERRTKTGTGEPDISTRVFNTSNWSVAATLSTNQVKDSAFSPDNSKLAIFEASGSGVNHIIRVYDTSNWNLLQSIDDNGDNSRGRSLAWSANGQWLAAAGQSNDTADRALHVYNTSNWSTAFDFNSPAGHGGSGWDVDFSPNSALLALAHGTRIYIFNTSDWSTAETIAAVGSSFNVCKFNSDGSLLAAREPRGSGPHLSIYETTTWAIENGVPLSPDALEWGDGSLPPVPGMMMGSMP